MVQIGQNIEKSPGDLRRFAVTQTPVKAYQREKLEKSKITRTATTITATTTTAPNNKEEVINI